MHWTAMKLGSYLEVQHDGIKTEDEIFKQETKNAVKFMVAFGMFRIPELNEECPICVDGFVRIHSDRSKKCGIYFGCSKGCGYKRSCFKGTWMENVYMTLKKTLYLLYLWVKKRTVTEMMDEGECSSHTAVDHANFCRELCEQIMQKVDLELLTVVEIDESLFHKRKYHKGCKKSGQQWVFGGMCRETNKCFLVEVPNRSSATLIPIIKRYIAVGTTIIADCWKAYSQLKFDKDFQFFTVNHSLYFVDPNNKNIHTNTVEGMWRLAKRDGPVTGTQCALSESYLSEFMWRKQNYGTDIFRKLLLDIGHVYQLEVTDNKMADYVDPDKMEQVLKNCHEAEVPWNTIFDPSVTEYFRDTADSLGVSLDLVCTSAVMFMPAVCKKGSKIEIGPLQKVHVVTYGVIAAQTRKGKSVVYANLIMPALEKIAKVKNISIEKLQVQSSSGVGVIERSIQNGGTAVICTDEGRQLFEGLHARAGKGESEKTMFLQAYDDLPYSYTMKNGIRQLKNSLVVIEIFIQPEVLILELMKEKTLVDGWPNRLEFPVPKVGNNITFAQSLAAQNRMVGLNQRKFASTCRKLAELELKSAGNDKFDTHGMALYELMYDDQDQSATSSDGSERDLLRTVRIAKSLYSLNNGMKNNETGKALTREHVAKEIPGVWLEKAQLVISKWKRHRSELYGIIEDMRKAETGKDAKGIVSTMSLEQEVWCKVGSSQGYVSSARDVSIAIQRGRKYTEVKDILRDMGNMGAIQYVFNDGKEWKIQGDCFLKKFPDELQCEWLDKMNISLEQYSKNFYAQQIPLSARFKKLVTKLYTDAERDMIAAAFIGEDSD